MKPTCNYQVKEQQKGGVPVFMNIVNFYFDK